MNIIDVVWEIKKRKSAEQHYLGVLSFVSQQTNPVPFIASTSKGRGHNEVLNMA